MAVVEVTEEDAEDGTEWRCKTGCGKPSRDNPKEEEERKSVHISSDAFYFNLLRCSSKRQ